MPVETTKAQSNQHTLNRALNSRAYNHVRLLLNSMPSAEAAHILESTPPRERNILWNLIDRKKEGEILPELSEEVRNQIVRLMDIDEIADVIGDLETDDLADLLQELPDTVTRKILQNLDDQNLQRVEAALAYPEDTAGGLMNTDSVTVRPNITLDVVLRYLRRHADIPSTTDTIFVVNRKDRYVGSLPLTKLLTNSPTSTVREAMLTDVKAIKVDVSDTEVAHLFERNDLVSAPVVDDENHLVGRITIDDVVDVIRDEAEHSIMSMAGLGEEDDTFAPVLPTSRRRAVWLGINLLTAFIASAMIGLFEGTIDKVVALAILMPIVASMGGIAGTQTLTLVIRGIALGQVVRSNLTYLIRREILVGIVNGIGWSVVVGAAASLWFKDPLIGILIASAMSINLLIAAITGACLPMILRKMGIDPALAGGVILTTITDVVGFGSFLGLATIFYI